MMHKNFAKPAPHTPPALPGQGRVLARIKSNVIVDLRGCWLWLGSLDGRGYGRVKVRGRLRKAHVAAFVEVRGEPPPDTVLDHLCRTRHCCNPEHLEPVPGVVNTRRGASLTNAKRAQTHCVRGHELVGENVYERRDRPGCRECRACKRLRRKVLAKGVAKYSKLNLGLPEDWNDYTPDRGPQ